MVLPVIKQTILTFFPEILNLQGHLNHCFGSKVMAILLNSWILLTGGVALGRVCPVACAVGLFLHKLGLSQNFFTPKKCVNYDESNSQHNSVKGPKDPNSAHTRADTAQTHGPPHSFKISFLLHNACRTCCLSPTALPGLRLD